MLPPDGGYNPLMPDQKPTLEYGTRERTPIRILVTAIGVGVAFGLAMTYGVCFVFAISRPDLPKLYEMQYGPVILIAIDIPNAAAALVGTVVWLERRHKRQRAYVQTAG